MARSRTDGPTDTASAFLELGEKLKATSKRPNLYGYDPHQKQLKFHKSTKRRRLYIGGNRSGKTTGGIIEDLWYATGTHPFKKTPDVPIRGRICASDFVNGHEKTIIPEILRWCPIGYLRGGSWHTAFDKAERTLHFANGSFIELMSYDQDLVKFAGTSRHFIHCDEEPPEDIYKENMARLIDTGGDAWFTMTPVDGMTWIYDKIYEPGVSNPDHPYIDIITVSMEENPYLNEAEVEMFLGDLDEDEKRARGKGEFIQLGGLIYKMFNPDMHIVDEFIPPKDWLWVASLDHGYNNPTAWLSHAVNPDGRIFTWAEYYEQGRTVDEHAKAVLDFYTKLGRIPDYFVGDPSIRNRSPITGTSIHQEYAKFGIPIILGNNDVQGGIVKVARYLKPNDRWEDKGPSLLVTANCKNTIREYTRYRWKTFASKKTESQVNKQEIPNKRDDHAMDSIRYFIMSQPELIGDLPSAVSSEQARNILGASRVIDPETDLIIPSYGGPVGDFGVRDGETSWGDFDESMGGIY